MVNSLGTQIFPYDPIYVLGLLKLVSAITITYFLVLDKVCIPIAKSKSAAYYANVIFTKAIAMVSSSKSFKA